MKAVAIIPAGGSGKRMGNEISKQYLLLDGIPILVHTLRKFEKASVIDDVILVVPGDHIEYSRRMIVEEYHLSKVRRVLAGGRERQDSVKNGLDAVGDDSGIVVIHDGVRPFVTEELINISVHKALEDGAVVVGVPVSDTVKSVDGDGLIERTVDRESLWLTQTPQTFRSEVIKTAYRKACDDNFHGTDDASLVERIGIKVRIITGSRDNIKITTPEDIAVGEGIIKRIKSEELRMKNEK
ncbi:MAG: 2-C-methyl-D-erythritol 4-phosphate cytidylyltransferase [Proteobacteria bacterium]|nr:2-C-methyl-D-erythritol 4-phosphate cytidylyltransferase [Pseudomonadota bacterium]